MHIVHFHNSKRVFAFILAVLACGMLFAETHGILGHAHSIPTAISRSSCNTPSAWHSMGLLASGQDSGDHSCGLCYCYRLLGQSLVPQACPIIDSSYDIQPILVHRLCLIHTSSFKTETRGPPQA
jgi:hypothetical protein